MNAPAAPLHFHPRAAARSASALEQRLRREVDGEVLFDAFSRGRYSTDASIYQIEPVGVVVPRSEDAARTALADRSGGRRPYPAARSRNVAVRADRRRGIDPRQLEVPQQRRRARRADTRSRRAARHRPRPAQRAAEASWPMVSRRCVHFGAGHHRRDGRQQLLRLALDPLRQYGAQRARDRSMAAERRHVLVRAQR